MEKLANAAHPVTKQPIFPTYRDLLCFAAVLGYDKGQKIPLGEKTDDFVDGRVLSNSDSTVDLMYLIALVSERNVDVLRDEQEENVATIFEQYANGGLSILRTWLKAKPDDLNGDRAILKALYDEQYLTSGNKKSLLAAAADVSF